MKSLALKVKPFVLASKPHVFDNFPVLGSRTALFFEPLKFYWKTPEISQKICKQFFCFSPLENAWKFSLKNFFFEIARKNCLKTFFFGEHLRLCPWPWPWAYQSLASRGSILGRVVLGLGLGFFVSLALASSLVPSLHLWSWIIRQQNKKAIYTNKFLVLQLGLHFPVHVSVYIYCRSLSCVTTDSDKSSSFIHASSRHHTRLTLTVK